MNKNIFSICILFLNFFLSTPSFSDSIERADQEDIKMLLNAASGTNSAFWGSLIGETRGRIYIEFTTAVHLSSSFSNKPKYTVYWIPSKELSHKDYVKFKEYKDNFEWKK